MYLDREDLDFYHQLRHIPDNQIPEGGAIAVRPRNEPIVAKAMKSVKAVVNKLTIVAATIAFGALLASGTAQPERVGGGTMLKIDQCFNYSEGNNWDGRFRLFWIPGATPCRPAMQSYGPE